MDKPIRHHKDSKECKLGLEGFRFIPHYAKRRNHKKKSK